jgi:ketosteroid isomerase-like protein
MNRSQKGRSLLALAAVLLALALIPPGAGGAACGEKTAVEKVIRANIGWALTKDRALLESTMVHDGRLLIINPDSEITAGWEPFAKNFDFWMDPRFKATGFDIHDLRIDFSPLGDAAWWSCVLDDLYEWDGKAGAWKDTRWTGVLEKRAGKWRIVQMHFSFAADKVAAEVKARLAGNPDKPEAGGDGIAIVTYVASSEQERAVRALIRSIRERGGNYKASPIYVVSAFPDDLSCTSLKQEGVIVLPLHMERAFLDYPLAIKAFAAAQVEEQVKGEVGTLVWLDPGVLVLGPPAGLALDRSSDVALRPVTLANTIGMPPQNAPDEYWAPIYLETGLDHRKLPALTTIADEVPVQPYYNCEVFSFAPRLGIAGEWARLLERFLKDDRFQKTACTSFPRRLFLHQAVLSAVVSARVRPERIKALPLASAYPFSQHGRLPAAKKTATLNDLALVIFDRTWQQDPAWLDKIRVAEPLRSWLTAVYMEYQSATGKAE